MIPKESKELPHLNQVTALRVRKSVFASCVVPRNVCFPFQFKNGSSIHGGWLLYSQITTSMAVTQALPHPWANITPRRYSPGRLCPVPTNQHFFYMTVTLLSELSALDVASAQIM